MRTGHVSIAADDGALLLETVKIISPIDGSVYAERPLATDAAGQRGGRARAGQRRPTGRGPRSPSAANTCSPCSKRSLAMNDEIVPELAWQMGRPVRYGGEYGGVKERVTLHGRDRRGGARPGVASNEKAGFRRYVKQRAARRRHGHRAVELSLPHRGQHDRPGADGRQRGDPQACRADAAGRRALRSRPSRRPACRRTSSRTSS